MQMEYNLKAPKGQVFAALNLARAGIPVFPVDAKKHPLVKWKGAATTDEGQVRKWWKRWPDAMPAFPTGEPSGIAVLDLDRKDGKDGVEALRRLGFEAESAFVVETASGGLHLWFKHTLGLRCSVGQDKDGLAGVDVRGERGFAVAPGAKGYTFKSGDLDLWADLRDVGCLPMWPENMRMQPRAVRASTGAEPSGLSFDALRSALLSLSFEDRERLFGSDAEWFKVCRIIVDETGGSEEGNALWHEFSEGWGGYDHHEAESKWCREDAYTGERASVWAILRPAVDAGWTHPDFEAWQAATAAEDFDGPDAVEEAEIDALVGTPSKALTQVEWGTPLMRGDKPVINLFNTTVYLGRKRVVDDDTLDDLDGFSEHAEEWRDAGVGAEADAVEDDTDEGAERVDPAKLEREIKKLTEYRDLAWSISDNAKGKALLDCLPTVLDEITNKGGQRKAVIFTESVRTQTYLREILEQNGFEGQTVVMNGSNSDKDSNALYKAWLEKHRGTDVASGSKAADMKAAIVEAFRNDRKILIATESGAEGINRQFCSLLINYDLPWNPQRVEQRIGRCHRYGQKIDVTVINFLNRKNHAEARIHQLLEQKFKLFEGVFGSSDEVLGVIESGVDIERRILDIVQSCRSTEEIDHALARGCEVTGVCRPESLGKIARFEGLITAHPGRTDDREVIARATEGCDGVLTVLAPWGLQNYASGTARAVLDLAPPGARLVFSCGWHISRDGRDRYGWKLRAIVAIFGRLARLLRFADLDDQVRATNLVFASDREWTVVRASDLEEGPSEGLPVWARHVGDPALARNRTRRTDFALFMVAALTNPELIREAPAISGRNDAHAQTGRPPFRMPRQKSAR